MEQHTDSQYDDDLTIGADEYDEAFQTSDVDLFEFGSDEESPISRLKTLVLSIDWEITDEVLLQFNEELLDLQDVWAGDKVRTVYLQALGKISKYIYHEKADAHPNAIKLLLGMYYNLERIVLAEDLSEAEKKQLLLDDIKKFEKLKIQIDKRPKKTREVEPVEKPVVDEVRELRDLKAFVLGIDWEITDKDLLDLRNEVMRLEEKFAGSKPKLVFLQGIGTLSTYIRKKKSDAHADAFTLLHVFYEGLEKIVRKPMSLEEEKAILLPEVEKFNAFKTIIAQTLTGKPVATVPEPPEEDEEEEEETVGGPQGQIIPAFADLPEEGTHGFREEEEAQTLGMEPSSSVLGHIDKFFGKDKAAPPAGKEAATSSPAPAEEEGEQSEVDAISEAFFSASEESEPVASVDRETALQGVEVETDADDDSEEEALPRFGDEIAPALSDSEEASIFSEAAPAVELEPETPSEELSDRLDSFFGEEETEKTGAATAEEQGDTAFGVPADIALQGVDVEAEEETEEEQTEEIPAPAVELGALEESVPPALEEYEEEGEEEGAIADLFEAPEAFEEEALTVVPEEEPAFPAGELTADTEEIEELKWEAGEIEFPEAELEFEEGSAADAPSGGVAEAPTSMEEAASEFTIEEEELGQAVPEAMFEPTEDEEETAIGELLEISGEFAEEEPEHEADLFAVGEEEPAEELPEAVDEVSEELLSAEVAGAEAIEAEPEPLAGEFSEEQHEEGVAEPVEEPVAEQEESLVQGEIEEQLEELFSEEAAAPAEDFPGGQEEEVPAEPAVELPEGEVPEEALAIEAQTEIAAPSAELVESREVADVVEEAAVEVTEDELLSSLPKVEAESPAAQEAEEEVVFELVEEEEADEIEEQPEAETAAELPPTEPEPQLEVGEVEEELSESTGALEISDEEIAPEAEPPAKEVQTELIGDAAEELFAIQETEEPAAVAEQPEIPPAMGVVEERPVEENIVAAEQVEEEKQPEEAEDEYAAVFTAVAEEESGGESEAVVPESTGAAPEMGKAAAQQGVVLDNLKGCVEALALELEDNVLNGLFSEINHLRQGWSNFPIEKTYLQLISTVTQHVDQYRYEASAEAHDLLAILVDHLEQCQGMETTKAQERLLADIFQILQWQQSMLHRQAVVRGGHLSFPDPLRSESGESSLEQLPSEELGDASGSFFAGEAKLGGVGGEEEALDMELEEALTRKTEEASSALSVTAEDSRFSDIVRQEIETLRHTLQGEIAELRKLIASGSTGDDNE